MGSGSREERAVPGCDAGAGTRPPDSILEGLFSHSIFVERATWEGVADARLR